MIETIERLHREGKTLREIARVVDVPHTRVRRILKSIGCMTSDYTWPQHAYRIAVRKHQNGYSYADIARYLNENTYTDGRGRYGAFTRFSVRRLILKGDPDE